MINVRVIISRGDDLMTGHGGSFWVFGNAIYLKPDVGYLGMFTL